MDPDQSSSTRRKVKFAPKAPPNRKPKPPPPSSETEAGDELHEDSAQAQAFLRRWNENLARRQPKVERKSSVQVAFGPGGSSPSLRTDGISKSVHSGKSSGTASEYLANEQNGLTRSLTAVEDQSDPFMVDVTDDNTNASAGKTKRDYVEPWDYVNSYYPITLPLRKPYSGDPEILDEEEFGEAATSVEYDENTVNPAAALGLLLPALPLVKQSVSIKGKEKIGTSTVSRDPTNRSNMEDLPSGYMGKMLVFKSGAIKLKLGETLFDVSPGLNCDFAQNVVAMNTTQKHCCVLGEISKRVVVTPDLDSIDL
ncbi:uncharacterized protein LOC133311921 isoform X2 [Gastrolobium bilobum]|uniref:uncharacterized protein LOC133311921 isoform X2 n=1 Tax=Gastrolobium bilobum TaxID=150636 RepID=UPI002AB1103B|nr:uncharacterized protein LOC133311921 isoform X2 [Gastrolobium bilobum]